MSSTRTSQRTVLTALAVLLITSACGAVAGLRPDSAERDVVGPLSAFRPAAEAVTCQR